MKITKRVLAIILIISFLCLSGCQGEAESSSNDTDKTDAEETTLFESEPIVSDISEEIASSEEIETEETSISETETTEIEPINEELSLIYGVNRWSVFLVDYSCFSTLDEELDITWNEYDYEAVDTGSGYELTGAFYIPVVIPDEGNAWLDEEATSFTDVFGMTYEIISLEWSDAENANPHPTYQLRGEDGEIYETGYNLAPSMYYGVMGYYLRTIVVPNVTITVPYGTAVDDVISYICQDMDIAMSPSFGIMLNENGEVCDIDLAYSLGIENLIRVS